MPGPRPAAPGSPRAAGAGAAWFPGLHLRDAVECVDLRAEPERVAAGGVWAVVGEFEGVVRAWRFAHVTRTPDVADGAPPATGEAWLGPRAADWRSSLDHAAYRDAVGRVREHVRAGDVYQVNVCRVLRAPLSAPDGREPSSAGLARVLAAGNPAPLAGGVHVPGDTGLPPAWVVSASPELFLDVADGVVTSSPIKGTATHATGLSAKDRAENVMIADMVRNDLQRVCDPGTVEVTQLLAVEQHPGLVHLVTTVAGRLRADGTGERGPRWTALLDATYPPASVSGAPKHAALGVIAALEPVPRGPYCGAVGWIDADAGRARLAVGIRTFWWTADDGGTLRFGTGAGITWDSDPDAEWDETELKARRLVALASR